MFGMTNEVKIAMVRLDQIFDRSVMGGIGMIDLFCVGVDDVFDEGAFDEGEVHGFMIFDARAAIGIIDYKEGGAI